MEIRIDYQTVSREIVQQLRGNLSQRELSEKLDYSFNKVGKWECGLHHVKWDDFILLCQIQGAPLEKAFRDSFWLSSSEFNGTTTLKALHDNFSGKIASENPFHTVLKKWESENITPDLAEILKLINTTPAALVGWLSLFLDCEKITVLAGPYKKLSIVVDLLYEHPTAAFVLAALQLEVYQSLPVHDETLLAVHSACTRQQLRSALEHLLSAGLIRFDGQKFRPFTVDFDISWLNHPKFRAVTKHATLLAARRFSSDFNSWQSDSTNNISYASERTACLSTDAYIEISKRILRFHNEAGEIISKDTASKNNVQVILSQTYLPVANARKTSHQSEPTDHESQNASLTNAITSLATVTHKSEIKIDFAIAAREILQAMRGDLSQRDLSSKLGYTFNQVGKWESGASQFKWDKFLRVCKTLNLPIENACRRTFLTCEPEPTPLGTLKALIHHFSAGIKLDKQTHRSMAKWLRGKSVPDLAEVLRFMHCRTALMLTWLSEIVDCNQISSLREANKLYLARSQAAFRTPDARLIYSALHLDAYQKLENHDENFLAEHTSCSLAQIRQIIQILNLNGFIQFDGKKYIPLSISEDHLDNWEAVFRATQRAALRYSIEPSTRSQDPHISFDFSVAAARIVALSAEGARLIRELIWKYQSEIGEIIKRDKSPKHHLVTIILHSYRSNLGAPADPDREIL